MSDRPQRQRQAVEAPYTFEWYRDFLDRLQRADLDFRTFERTLEPGEVVLRHDVDLSPSRALEVARIEDELGVTATYFFLVSSPLYNPLHEPTREVLREISALGHDVGLHFSTHQYWPADDPPDDPELVERVERELETLSIAVDATDAISFHIPPEWALGRRFDGFTSAYESRFLEDVAYVADSDQRWREDPPVDGDVPRALQVLTHPGLWGVRDAPFHHRVQNATSGSNARVSEYVTSRYLEQEYG